MKPDRGSNCPNRVIPPLHLPPVISPCCPTQRQMRMLPSQSRNLTRVGPCDRDKEDLPTKRAVVRILVAPHDLSRPQR